MPNVAILGLGFMGGMHYAAYGKVASAQVVAVAARDPKKAAGDLSGAWGNMPGVPEQLDMTRITGTTDVYAPLSMPGVDVVDICLPTPMHADLAVAALEAGKHVVCEKPLAIGVYDTRRIVDAASASAGSLLPAMCIRYWPAYAWLKQVVDDGRYGPLRSLTMRRVTFTPPSGWFLDAAKSGGALWDLHIHDSDFVQHLLGMPEAVSSAGRSVASGGVDHVVTRYDYGGGPVVQAEGAWLPAGSGFSMTYQAAFDGAYVDYDAGREAALLLTLDGETQTVRVSDADGYTEQLRDFVRCIDSGQACKTVTPVSALDTARLLEAEAHSVESGGSVSL